MPSCIGKPKVSSVVEKVNPMPVTSRLQARYKLVNLSDDWRAPSLAISSGRVFMDNLKAGINSSESAFFGSASRVRLCRRSIWGEHPTCGGNPVAISLCTYMYQASSRMDTAWETEQVAEWIERAERLG